MRCRDRFEDVKGTAGVYQAIVYCICAERRRVPMCRETGVPDDNLRSGPAGLGVH